MGITITKEAADFLLGQMRAVPTAGGQPLRLREIRSTGCGDIGSRIERDGTVLPGDTVVHAHGISIVYNTLECPSFVRATVTLVKNGTGSLANRTVVVIPDGAHVCGCGESAAMPKP